MSARGYATDYDLGIPPGRSEREDEAWDAHVYDRRRFPSPPWRGRLTEAPRPQQHPPTNQPKNAT